jgi:hypothetical protein
LWFPREEFLRSAETRRKEEQDRLTVLVTMKHGISKISTGFYSTKRILPEIGTLALGKSAISAG